ncbi:hypothetical protein P12x_005746 [Tundrisphaera lichenicola]|uniref:hypothetical protein n=1 Tax=Tundrisphaera lichenicola TaxID=2029860 RepID=UPI003EBBF8C8
MSWALLTTLFAILGTGLAVLSALSFVLWRQVRALTRDRSGFSAPLPPRERAGVRVLSDRPNVANEANWGMEGDAESPHPNPLPGGEGVGKGTIPVTAARPRGPMTNARDELTRRLDDLSGRHRVLETRLEKVEAALAAAPRSGRRVDRGTSAISNGPTLISVPNLAAPPGQAREAAAEFDRRFGDVWAMADAGMSPQSIASETGHPIGQVELILGLRRQLPATEARPDA